MHELAMDAPSREFAACWRESGGHLERMAQGSLSWLKANLNPPFLEHLSFRLGNQLFFVQIKDADGMLRVPGTLAGLMTVALGCGGHPCLMPMQRRGGSWRAVQPGWGLVDARSRAPLEPPTLVTDAKIEMTDWELHDFAVQLVRQYLEESGRELMSWQSNLSADPSIWFVGARGPEWVVVREVRYPATEAAPPANLAGIRAQCARLSATGHFASVSVANADDAFDADISPVPLWRGHATIVRFLGLAPV